jgi:HTH-type transcriptional regulator/antitoxin HigA
MKDIIEKILTEEQYEKLMAEILNLMNKGETNLTESELEDIREMALLAQAYEREHHYPPQLR